MTEIRIPLNVPLEDRIRECENRLDRLEAMAQHPATIKIPLKMALGKYR